MSENMTDQELTENLLSLLKEFNGRGLGNPFNYNRAFEYLQASLLGFHLTKVGGGSDGVEWTFPNGTSASVGDDILIYRVGNDPNFFWCFLVR